MLNNKTLWAIVLLVFIMLLHTLFVGLKSDQAEIIVFRFFLQVLPVIIFLIVVLEKKEFIYQFSYGIIIFGMLLFLTLIIATDMLSAMLIRGDFRDVVGMSPIGLSRRAGIVFLTALMLIISSRLNPSKKYVIFIVITGITALAIMVISTTRGPALAVLITLLALFLIKEKNLLKKIYRLTVLSGLLIASGLFTYYYLNFEVLIMFIERMESLQNYESMRRYRRLDWAFDFIKNDFGIFSVNMWLGLGPAGFSYLFGLGYVHNFILEFIIEYGLIGIMSISLFTVYSFYHSILLIRYNKFLYIPAIFIFLYLSAMVSGDIVSNRNLLFISVVQAISIYFLKNNKNI